MAYGGLDLERCQSAWLGYVAAAVHNDSQAEIHFATAVCR